MKKLLRAIAAAVFILCPAFSFSSYIIHLKDGREFATEQYSEEGDQIKFKRYGGVIGIQKDLIREIEVIEEVEELPAEKDKTVPVKADVNQSSKKQAAKAGGTVEEGEEEVPEKVAKEQEKPENAAEQEKKKAEEDKADIIEAFLKEKREVIEERKLALEAFKDAKAKNDKAAVKKHFQRIVSLGKKRKKLEKRVKAAFGGKLPDWWQE